MDPTTHLVSSQKQELSLRFPNSATSEHWQGSAVITVTHSCPSASKTQINATTVACENYPVIWAVWYKN